jgi:hypothetical protein
MVFYEALGWGVFWISFVLAIILFAKYKRIYPVFYLISVALYIFTAGFIIDVFNLGKFGILSVLVISAIVFMVLGYYLSKVFHIAD